MNLVPQFGFLELIVVAVVALIVVGPKDLPKLMKSAGKLMAKARAMAREFTNAFDQMAHEAELEDLRNEIETLKKENPFLEAKSEIEKDLASAEKDLHDEMADIESAAATTQPGDETATREAAPQDSAAKVKPAAQHSIDETGRIPESATMRPSPERATESAPAPSSGAEQAPAEDRAKKAQSAAETARRGEHATS
jgi:sec-independent protein translocase protein TatB